MGELIDLIERLKKRKRPEGSTEKTFNFMLCPCQQFNLGPTDGFVPIVAQDEKGIRILNLVCTGCEFEIEIKDGYIVEPQPPKGPANGQWT